MPRLSLHDVKSYLGYSDDSQDALLFDLMRAAEAAVEGYIGRSLSVRDYTEVYRFNRLGIPLLHVPVVEVVWVRDNGRDLSFRLDGDVVLVSSPFSSSVLVHYRAGYVDWPEDLRLAVLYTVAAMATARGLDQNFVATSVGGVVSGAYQPYGAGSLPMAARSLLEPYRSRGVVLLGVG